MTKESGKLCCFIRHELTQTQAHLGLEKSKPLKSNLWIDLDASFQARRDFCQSFCLSVIQNVLVFRVAALPHVGLPTSQH